jgi:hypothetical protein
MLDEAEPVAPVLSTGRADDGDVVAVVMDLEAQQSVAVFDVDAAGAAAVVDGVGDDLGQHEERVVDLLAAPFGQLDTQGASGFGRLVRIPRFESEPADRHEWVRSVSPRLISWGCYPVRWISSRLVDGRLRPASKWSGALRLAEAGRRRRVPLPRSR